MFRALLAHPQESLHKRHLIYCVLCQLAAPGAASDITRNTCISSAACATSPEDEQAMLKTCTGPSPSSFTVGPVGFPTVTLLWVSLASARRAPSTDVATELWQRKGELWARNGRVNLA
jgi:hypothetical protein